MATRNLFGSELRRLRREAKLNLADLADAVGCTITLISDIERNKKNPPASDKIKKLLQRLGRLELYSRMLVLAAASRNSVEISVKNKSSDVTHALTALARRCDEGQLDDDTARRILKVLGEEELE